MLINKEIELEGADEKLHESVTEQLNRNKDFQIESKGGKQIEVKFGSWWSWKDNKRGTAKIKFEEDKSKVKIDFSFLGEWILASLLIYFPILLVVIVSGFGGIYSIMIVFLILMLFFIKYHHSTFQKTAENYHSKLKSILYVIQSDELKFCPNCGQEVDISSGERPICNVCGYELREDKKNAEQELGPQDPQTDPSKQFFERKISQARPFGVSLLAVLYVFGGILSLLGLIPQLGLAALPQRFGTIGTVLVIVEGIANFGIAYGLWNGMKWAWIAAIIFAIIGLLNIILGTIVSIIILFYLFKKEVKEYFK